MKNQIVEVLIRRDGLTRSEAEEELRHVRAEFDPCRQPFEQAIKDIIPGHART